MGVVVAAAAGESTVQTDPCTERKLHSVKNLG